MVNIISTDSNAADIIAAIYLAAAKIDPKYKEVSRIKIAGQEDTRMADIIKFLEREIGNTYKYDVNHLDLLKLGLRKLEEKYKKSIENASVAKRLKGLFKRSTNTRLNNLKNLGHLIDRIEKKMNEIASKAQPVQAAGQSQIEKKVPFKQKELTKQIPKEKINKTKIKVDQVDAKKVEQVMSSAQIVQKQEIRKPVKVEIEHATSSHKVNEQPKKFSNLTTKHSREETSSSHETLLNLRKNLRHVEQEKSSGTSTISNTSWEQAEQEKQKVSTIPIDKNKGSTSSIKADTSKKVPPKKSSEIQPKPQAQNKDNIESKTKQKPFTYIYQNGSQKVIINADPKLPRFRFLDKEQMQALISEEGRGIAKWYAEKLGIAPGTDFTIKLIPKNAFGGSQSTCFTLDLGKDGSYIIKNVDEMSEGEATKQKDADQLIVKTLGREQSYFVTALDITPIEWIKAKKGLGLLTFKKVEGEQLYLVLASKDKVRISKVFQALGKSLGEIHVKSMKASKSLDEFYRSKGDLPKVLVHPDFQASNIIYTNSGKIQFIDNGDIKIEETLEKAYKNILEAREMLRKKNCHDLQEEFMEAYLGAFDEYYRESIRQKIIDLENINKK
ncbi:MAG: hypothetical protein K0S74_610 [Chlamydiales bacterium]|jgi:hypothetical protein|nr:hypothetical protein [Chlamydiales bacterium]